MKLVKYLVKRILLMLLTMFIIITITFFLMRMIPGDPLAHMARALPDQIRANFLAKYGLDKPLFEQYLIYMENLLRGDLGESLIYQGRPVLDSIKESMGPSATSGGLALILGLIIGILSGIVAALFKNRWPDYVVMVLAILGITVPAFLLGSIFQWIFAVKLKVLPAAGWGEPKHYIIPVVIMSFGTIATYARYIKSSMLDTLGQDYVMTARAKGLSEYKVIMRHVMRNSLMPSLTILSARIVDVLTGAFVIERMFAIPGMGYYFVSSVTNNDYTMIQGVTVLYAGLFVLSQFIVDILYSVVDPRIRLGGLDS